jgi:hypothetical protein
MNILEFKDNIVNPLQKTIEQYKAPTLAQFKSLDDVKIQWARAEGLEMALNHVEATYAASLQTVPQQEAQVVEILPPE